MFKYIYFFFIALQSEDDDLTSIANKTLSSLDELKQPEDCLARLESGISSLQETHNAFIAQKKEEYRSKLNEVCELTFSDIMNNTNNHYTREMVNVFNIRSVFHDIKYTIYEKNSTFYKYLLSLNFKKREYIKDKLMLCAEIKKDLSLVNKQIALDEECQKEGVKKFFKDFSAIKQNLINEYRKVKNDMILEEQQRLKQSEETSGPNILKSLNVEVDINSPNFLI